ncbi:MAG: glycine cleavage system protein GcvH [Anaerolineales bacterium]|nr:glycine cleavage system protein GcvH [Anaerolineales bacterium]
MIVPNELKYTKTDEWVRVEGNQASMGITDYAQSQLSDIVYVEVFPKKGDALAQGKPAASVESVKAAAEIYLPAGGTVTDVNPALAGAPEVINKDPYGEGWMVKFTLSDPAELDLLMDAKSYEAYCAGRQR